MSRPDRSPRKIPLDPSPNTQEPPVRPTVASLKTTRITPDKIASKVAEPKLRKPPRETGRKPSSTGFRGVAIAKPGTPKPYQARLYLSVGTTRFLGRFATTEEAARAYDVAALAEFGPAARLNFPERKPSAATNGHAKNGRLPSVERLNFGETEPKLAGKGSELASVRAELRAMGEVLSIAEKFGPDVARRVLAWVAARLGIEQGRP